MTTKKQAGHLGNGQIGDECLYWMADLKDRLVGPCPREGKIVETGLINPFGHPLDLRVEFLEPPETLQLSCHEPRLLILPKPEELNDEVKNFASMWELIVVRKPCNTDNLRYQFVCKHCMENLYLVNTTTEIAGFNYEGDSFYESKPCLDEGGRELVCDCKDRSFDVPENLEDFT